MLLALLGVVLMLAEITLAVVAVMAVVLYGSQAFGWGFHHYPKSAAMVAFVLIVALFVAALSFNRLFPGCNFTWGMFGGYSHCTPIR